MEGEAAKADDKHERDEEIMIGASLISGAPEQELEPDQGGNQKGDIARRIDGLGQQRLVGAALAIDEDALAECHGPKSLRPGLRSKHETV